MIERIIEWSLRNRFLVACAALLLIALGIRAVYLTPVDAIPDLTENQVLVYADWAGRSPQEVEDQVTYPLTTGLQGLSGVKEVRATSMFGFSLSTIIFEDGVDTYFARTRVLERLNGRVGIKRVPLGVVALGHEAVDDRLRRRNLARIGRERHQRALAGRAGLAVEFVLHLAVGSLSDVLHLVELALRRLGRLAAGRTEVAALHRRGRQGRADGRTHRQADRADHQGFVIQGLVEPLARRFPSPTGSLLGVARSIGRPCRPSRPAAPRPGWQRPRRPSSQETPSPNVAHVASHIPYLPAGFATAMWSLMPSYAALESTFFVIKSSSITPAA